MPYQRNFWNVPAFLYNGVIFTFAGIGMWVFLYKYNPKTTSNVMRSILHLDGIEFALGTIAFGLMLIGIYIRMIRKAAPIEATYENDPQEIRRLKKLGQTVKAQINPLLAPHLDPYQYLVAGWVGDDGKQRLYTAPWQGRKLDPNTSGSVIVYVQPGSHSRYWIDQTTIEASQE